MKIHGNYAYEWVQLKFYTERNILHGEWNARKPNISCYFDIVEKWISCLSILSCQMHVYYFNDRDNDCN